MKKLIVLIALSVAFLFAGTTTVDAQGRGHQQGRYEHQRQYIRNHHARNYRYAQQPRRGRYYAPRYRRHRIARHYARTHHMPAPASMR